MSPRPVVRIRGWVTPRGVRVTALTVRAPSGARIAVRCRGASCPRARWAHAASLVRLIPFQRRLRAGDPARHHGHPARLRRQVDRAGDPPRESAGARRPLPVPRRSEGAGMSELMSPAARWGVAAAATVGFVTALLLSAFGGGGLRTTDVELSARRCRFAPRRLPLRRPGPPGSRRCACRRSTCARRAPPGRAGRPRPSRRRPPLRQWSRSPHRRAPLSRHRSPCRRPRRPLLPPRPVRPPRRWPRASPRRNRPPRALRSTPRDERADRGRRTCAAARRARRGHRRGDGRTGRRRRRLGARLGDRGAAAPPRRPAAAADRVGRALHPPTRRRLDAGPAGPALAGHDLGDLRVYAPVAELPGRIWIARAPVTTPSLVPPRVLRRLDGRLGPPRRAKLAGRPAWGYDAVAVHGAACSS